jgi:hypothetical protein
MISGLNKACRNVLRVEVELMCIADHFTGPGTDAAMTCKEAAQ